LVALRAGSSGFLTKEIEPDELRRAVKAVAAGNGWRPALFAIVSKPSSWSYETGARPAEGVSIIEMNLENNRQYPIVDRSFAYGDARLGCYRVEDHRIL